jgi:predicted glycosyltransferase
MVRSAGVLCGAGFQTPSEVLYLKKKLLAVPMKGQYEQQCNAAALKLLGIPVIKNLKRKQIEKIAAWMESEPKLLLDYPNETEDIVDAILERHARQAVVQAPIDDQFTTASRFRDYILKKIFYQTGS